MIWFLYADYSYIRMSCIRFPVHLIEDVVLPVVVVTADDGGQPVEQLQARPAQWLGQRGRRRPRVGGRVEDGGGRHGLVVDAPTVAAAGHQDLEDNKSYLLTCLTRTALMLSRLLNG